MSDFIQVVSTTETPEQAARIAKHLVAERLAACVQIEGPLTSRYHWQGRVEETREWRLTAKCRSRTFGEVAAAIRSLHPYDVPEIVATEIVYADEAYRLWLEQETRGEKGAG